MELIPYVFPVELFAFIISFLPFLGLQLIRPQREWLWQRVLEIPAMVINPLLFLLTFDMGNTNSCCGDSPVFSPGHRAGIYTLICASLCTYFYSAYRKKLSPPLLEVVVNCILIAGLILDILIAIDLKSSVELGIIGCLPVAIFIVLRLAQNHQMALSALSQNEASAANAVTAWCRQLLLAPAFKKFPLLMVLCLPILVFLSTALLLFGQKPDSLVRAFTDTYHQRFSQLDYQCEGIVCGGHFLCTIAAQGHRQVVKPVRTGVRADRIITCNRQLLVSNAFEELLEQKVPWLHRPIRKFYNNIGRFIHRYYSVFNHRWVSDLIYVLMKPLEWFFLFVLYLCCVKPENRIAVQYMDTADRNTIRRQQLKG